MEEIAEDKVNANAKFTEHLIREEAKEIETVTAPNEFIQYLFVPPNSCCRLAKKMSTRTFGITKSTKSLLIRRTRGANNINANQ